MRDHPKVSRGRTVREVRELTVNVIGAAAAFAPWQLPGSVLGRLGLMAPPAPSEYAMFLDRDLGRSARYLTNVIIPSLQRRGPAWLPAVARDLFFHQTTVKRWPDPRGDLTSVPDERWVFINGILTDPGMAGWNATYLAELFRRPITIIQNATDGPIADLLECADEKAFGMNGEPADVAFPEIHRALKDPSLGRIVIVAHSQGTLIASVLLRLLRLVDADVSKEGAGAGRRSDRAQLARAGVTLEPDDFEPVSREELARLEIYCFANCANEMRYVDEQRRLPWIESFGNEYDLVARLGMLAPRRTTGDIVIDGPMWLRRGGWGHLLNHHYLHPIERAQMDPATVGPRTSSPAPFEAHVRDGSSTVPDADHPSEVVPRLFRYLNGGGRLV